MNSPKLKLVKAFLTFCMIFFIQISYAQTEEQLKIITEAQDAKTVFIKYNPQLADLFLAAKAYIIFPDLKEGTYAINGVAGTGVVYKDDKVLGTSQLTQEDVGMDLEGRSFREVILFENETQFTRFTRGHLLMATNRRNEILYKDQAKDLDFREGLLLITMPKDDAQIDISVEGQRFTFNKF